MTADTIARLTGLSVYQVRYRVSQFGVSIMSYRRGESQEARMAIREVNRMLKEISGLNRKLPR